MIISELLLKGISSVPPEDFLSGKCKLKIGELIINLCSDLRFLRSGYYVSLYAIGTRVIPSIADLSDLYCPSVAFRRLAGKIPVMEPEIIDEAPNGRSRVLIFSLNQLNRERYFVARSKDEKQRCYESASLHRRYPVAFVPLKGKLKESTVIFGDCTEEEHANMAREVFREFKIPVFKLLVQGRKFSGMLPLSVDQLKNEELRLLEQKLMEIEGGHSQWER